ncbi:MAG TPA: hypothetical protein VD793_09630, partial [Gemmatimonadales bacterium]|nr:hypothetical protein [Gemmatimonadales bacterium]
MTRVTRLIAGLGLGLMGAACGGEEVVVFAPETIEKVSGDGQSAPAGGVLPVPLSVMVRTADGSPAPRAAVRWTMTAGAGATLSDTSTLSDGTGQSQVTLRLGPAAGSYGVQAQLALRTDRVVQFMATGLAPPVLSSVSPSTFAGGDTIVVTATGLDTTVLLEVSGAPARRLSVIGSTTLNAVVPVCLAPGPVTLVARVRTAVSNGLSATYISTAEPIQLSVGDYAAVDPARVAGCALLPPVSGGVLGDTAEYLIAPQHVNGVTGDSASYRLRGDTATVTFAPEARAPRTTFALAFHDALRAAEAGFARATRPPFAAEAPGAAQAPAIDVGDRRQFRVCSKFGCNPEQDFAQVTAEAKYVGQRAALYLDLAAPPGFSATDYETLGALFDDQLYDVGTRAFGAESDVDQNGRILILFTPVVNALTPKAECSQSFVTGFFFGIDIDPAFANDNRSNHGEVFYAIVPDSAQTVTCRFTVSAVRRLVPVT